MDVPRPCNRSLFRITADQASLPWGHFDDRRLLKHSQAVSVFGPTYFFLILAFAIARRVFLNSPNIYLFYPRLLSHSIISTRTSCFLLLSLYPQNFLISNASFCKRPKKNTVSSTAQSKIPSLFLKHLFTSIILICIFVAVFSFFSGRRQAFFV
jgi:hypothetical protein